MVQEEQLEGSGGEGRIAWMISDWDGHRFWTNDNQFMLRRMEGMKTSYGKMTGATKSKANKGDFRSMPLIGSAWIA